MLHVACVDVMIVLFYIGCMVSVCMLLSSI
jgi:hypothetical protein